ncbi:hypothetical protein AKJ64_03145, partial [candidate division MSBL1 archaeon SCGC-AAA259E17]
MVFDLEAKSTTSFSEEWVGKTLTLFRCECLPLKEVFWSSGVFNSCRAKKMKEKPPPEREKFIQKARDGEFPELIATLRKNEGNKRAAKAATKIENALPDMFRGVRDP